MPFLSADTRLWVAYSGGCDSHVLLHLLSRLRVLQPFQLHAVYVNHGLSQHASEWGQHCQQVCQNLDVDFVSLMVDATPRRGESPEAAARFARYQAIADLLDAGDYVCTAHHQDDQAETLLLQLLRGAGVKGLAAMPQTSALGKATQLRPLLNVSHAMIQAYAEQHELDWINDESNADTGFDRNYLRHEIMPRLRQRWPSADATLARSAANCADAAELLTILAQQDYVSVKADTSAELLIEKVLMLDPARMKNVLRYWIGLSGLPLPSDNKLQHLISDVLRAADDKQPLLHWPGVEIRRFDGRLYAMTPMPESDTTQIIPWHDLTKPLALPDGRKLYCEKSGHPGLNLDVLTSSTVTIRFRQGGETIQPVGSQRHKSLKNIFQERSVPVWLRSRIPLLYTGEQLHVVTGICYSAAVSSENNAYQVVIS